jgi:hypothetical protein
MTLPESIGIHRSVEATYQNPKPCAHGVTLKERHGHESGQGNCCNTAPSNRT